MVIFADLRFYFFACSIRRLAIYTQWAYSHHVAWLDKLKAFAKSMKVLEGSFKFTKSFQC